MPGFHSVLLNKVTTWLGQRPLWPAFLKRTAFCPAPWAISRVFQCSAASCWGQCVWQPGLQVWASPCKGQVGVVILPCWSCSSHDLLKPINSSFYSHFSFRMAWLFCCSGLDFKSILEQSDNFSFKNAVAMFWNRIDLVWLKYCNL